MELRDIDLTKGIMEKNRNVPYPMLQKAMQGDIAEKENSCGSGDVDLTKGIMEKNRNVP
ncbi:MAG: hypothetical protein JSU03_13080 [Bacteroidetes bacterium]|nr:hypothetical protein [Bacteroidota bacterium]